MKKTPTLDQLGKRTDIFRLHRKHIIIPERKPGERFNVRQNFGDINTLAEQILAAGSVRIPLLGHHCDGKFHVTDGERRIRAIDLLAKRGHGEFSDNIPVKPEPKTYTEKNRTLDMLFCASGKPLEMIEQAEIFRRLRDEHGLKVKELSKEGGVTQQHVYDCLALIAAPESVKDAVKDGKVSATLAVTIVKESKTPAAAAAAITDGIAKASTLGKSKATAAHIPTRRAKANNDLKAAKKDLHKRQTRDRMTTQPKDQVDSVDKLRQIVEAVPRSRADYNKMDALEWIIDYLLGHKTLADACNFFKE